MYDEHNVCSCALTYHETLMLIIQIHNHQLEPFIIFCTYNKGLSWWVSVLSMCVWWAVCIAWMAKMKNAYRILVM